MSTLDAIRASRPKVVPVTLQSGATAYVKSMSGSQRVIWNSTGQQSDVLLAVFGLCEQNGQRLFDPPESGVAIVGEMDGEDVYTIAVAVLKVSGIIKDKKEEGANPSNASQN